MSSHDNQKNWKGGINNLEGTRTQIDEQCIFNKMSFKM